jgi:hypothetical protein
MSGAINRRTSTIVVVGRSSPKNSACAHPNSAQREMSVTNRRSNDGRPAGPPAQRALTRSGRVRHEHARASDACAIDPEPGQRTLDQLEAALRLRLRVTGCERTGTRLVDRSGAGHEDQITGSQRSAVPDLLLPHCPGRHSFELRHAGMVACRPTMVECTPRGFVRLTSPPTATTMGSRNVLAASVTSIRVGQRSSSLLAMLA